MRLSEIKSERIERPKSWLLRWWFLLGVSLTTFGCGALDYDELEKPPADWKEVALRAKLNPPQVDRKCFGDALCLRAPYFGEEQLSLLVLSDPEIISLKADGESKIYSLRSSSKLLIESDIFVLNEGVTLKTCSDVEVVSSEISGVGAIDSSALGCEKMNGSNISIHAGEVGGLRLVANGKDGVNGNLNSKRIDIEFERKPVKLCIDGSACMIEAATGFSRDGKTDAQVRDELERRGGSLARKNIEYLKGQGVPVEHLQEECSRFYSGFKDLELGDTLMFYVGAAGCFYSSNASVEGETGLLADMHVVDISRKGGDQFLSLGEAGGRGGNAGKIEVVARKIDTAEIQALGGRGGSAGKSFMQGVGNASVEIPSQLKFRIDGHLLVETLPDQKGIIQKQYLKAAQSFEIKKPLQFNEFSSNKNDSMFAIQFTKPIDGVDGEKFEPQVIRAPVDAFVLRKIQERCPGCARPKALNKE